MFRIGNTWLDVDSLSERSFLFLHDKLYCADSGCIGETDVTTRVSATCIRHVAQKG